MRATKPFVVIIIHDALKYSPREIDNIKDPISMDRGKLIKGM